MSLFKQFTGKTVAFPSTDVITVTLLFTLKFIYLRVAFCFLPQKIIIFFFAHSFFNNFVNPKSKTVFTKQLNGNIYYIFLIEGIQKLRGFAFKRIMDFIGYDNLLKPYKSIFGLSGLCEKASKKIMGQ